MKNEKINSSLLSLEKYILNEGFKGYDPYDFLTCPFFGYWIFKENKLIRLFAQQLGKKSVINIRPLLRIKKGYNPVTLGLMVQAFTYQSVVFPKNRKFYNNLIQRCLVDLKGMSSKGYSGYCWGYDFDWQGRYSSIPAYTPTIVATGIITNALFQNYLLMDNQESFDICENSANFVMNDLNRVFFNDVFCFSYSPNDRQVVYNATMKGARLLAQVFSVNKNENLFVDAKKTVQFVIENQRDNGAWGYSKGDSRNWVDNFHTCYILDCLGEYIDLTHDFSFEPNLMKGIDFYVKNFFYKEKIPKYYNNKIYPIDSTAAAASIITLTRFDSLNLASNVANYMIRKMQDDSGYFYYQKNNFLRNKISYMRWSNAWMYLALSYFLFKNNNIN